MNSDLQSLNNSDEKIKKEQKFMKQQISQLSKSQQSKSPLGNSQQSSSPIIQNRYINPEIEYLGYIKQKIKDNKKQNKIKNNSPSLQKSRNQSLSISNKNDNKTNFKTKAYNSQQNWQSPKIKSPLIDMFNFEFYSPNQEFTNRQFLQLFQKSQENNLENKKKLQTLIMQLICTQVMDKMEILKIGVEDEDEDDGLPQVYHKNRMHWLQMLIQTPRIQKFHCNMVYALDRLISSELIQSNKIFKTYIKNQHLTKTAHQQYQSDFQKLIQITEEPIPKILRDQIQNNSEKKTSQPYFHLKDYKLEQILDERVEQGLKQAKYNYKKIQKEKRKKQMQMTGSLKYSNQKSGSRLISDDKFILKVNRQKDGTTKIKFEEFLQPSLKEQTQEEKEAYDKFLRAKYKDQLMTDFQKKLLQSTEKVQSLVETIDDTNDQMLTVVKETNQALEDLQAEREKYSQSIPGEKIYSLIRQWADDQVYSPQDMKIYASELWISLKEFEKQIREEEKGYQIRYRCLQDKYQSHIGHIQRQVQFRIEAYETALIQLKVQSRREIDRLNMQIEDVLSKGLYDEKDTQKNTNDLIQKAEDGLVLRNTIEARAIINQFVSALKINQTQSETLKDKLERQNKLIDVFETRLQDKEAFYEEEKKLRKFYQKTLIKMVRELNLFEDDLDKKQKFQLVNEDEDDLNYQRQISYVLQNINLQQACIDHTNKYFGQKEGIIKIQQNLNEIGIIDKSDSFSTSEDSENNLYQTTLEIDPAQTINKKGGKQVIQNQIQATQNSLQIPNKKIQQKQQSPNKPVGNFSPQANFKETPQNEALLKYVQDQEKKKKKKEALKSLQTALKDAIEGNLENPVSTEESGGAPTQINQTDLRLKLTALIAEVSPEMLQDFRFNKDQEEIIPTPVKPVKKASKKLSELKSVIKKKESIAISIASKKDEEKKEVKIDNGVKIVKQESVVNKQIVQKIQKKEEKKQVEVDEIKKKDQVQESARNEILQNNETDQNNKSIKKKETVNLKIEKKEEQDIKSEIPQVINELQQIKQQEENQFSRDNSVNEQKIVSNKVTEEISIKTPLKNPTIKQTQDQINLEKVITPEVIAPVVDATIKDQQVIQEGPQGICLIQQELSKLYDKKFGKILQNYQAADEKKMKAVQINQMQDLVEKTLGIQLPYGERMELFQAEITNFFSKLNELIVKQFDFAKIHQFIASSGQQETKKETKLEKQKTENNLKKISFGNFLKPNFSPSGEFMGFELRPELVSLMFQFNDQQQNILKRAIKSCIYINRLLIYGQSNDFLLKQFKDGEMVDEVDTNKNQVDAECQVDLIELFAHQQIEEEEKEKEKEEELEVPEDGCEQLLREFGVAMMIRMDPENENKRNYYDMIFSSLSGHRLLGYYLDDVFLTMDDRSKNRKITLEKMFCNFQDQIFNIVYDIQIEQRKQLITEKMLSLSVGYNKTDEKTFSSIEIQATVPTRSIMSFTGNELLTAFMAKGSLIIKKSKNQLVLDKAMEEEFKMTLDMFDQFAQQLSKLESDAQQKLNLENINKDLDYDSDLVSNKGNSSSKKKLKTNKFKGNEKNKEKVQSVQKIQNEITGLIINVQKTGALTQQVDEINQKEQKKQSKSKLTSNAKFLFSNEESFTSLTNDQSGYVNNPQMKNSLGKNLQTSQTQQIQGITNSMKPFVTQPSARLKIMKAGQKLSEETDPSRIAATKKFNAILRQKLSKIMIKNQYKAIEIDRILNSNTELQNGYSSHFNSIEGVRNGFNTTSMYESLIAGVDLEIFKKSRRSKRKQILNAPSGNILAPSEFNSVSTQNVDLGLNNSLDQASQVNFENIDTEQPEIIISVTKQKGSRNGKFLQQTKSTVTKSKNVVMIKSQEITDQSTNSIRNTNDIASTYKLQQAPLTTPMTVKTQKFQDKLNTAMLYRQSEIQRKVLNYDSAMADISQVPNYLLSDQFYKKQNRIDNTKTTLDKLVHSKVLDNQKQFAGWGLINQQMDKIRQGTNKQLSPINFVGLKSPIVHLRSPLEKNRPDAANSPLSEMNISYQNQGIGRQSMFEEEAMRAIKNKLDFDDFKKHVVSKSYHQQVFKELNIKGFGQL